MGGTQVCGGWFDRNSPHRARSLLRDRKLEEPPRDFPTGLGIDPRDLSAAHHLVHRYHAVSNLHRSLRKRLTAANEDYIGVHALPGRPLQVDGDKKSLSMKRVAANREDRIRSHDLHKRSTVRQYLVRVQHPITPSKYMRFGGR